ncbi:hypothetical protein DESC_190161 [Desulfosarcina cetonica]|nr:hypothetical protein DESC_190161 [Desulfosarcina cetonica]
MARANRHFIQGQIWHLSHRCHKREFLLKFSREWEDRYHATAIESGDHLWRCIVYVDLNMVRAGVVSHPSEWKWGGFHEIQSPKNRYRLIDHDMLKGFLNIEDQDEMVKATAKSRALCPPFTSIDTGCFFEVDSQIVR